MNVSPLARQLDQFSEGNKASLLQLLGELRAAAQSLWASGTTANRPPNPYLGQLYFDTTLGYLVECTVASPLPATWSQLVTPMTAPVAGTTFTTVTATGAGSALSPAWATACEIYLQGPGGGTVATTGGAAPRGGAASGEFVHRVIPITPSTLYNFNVGAAVAGAIGSDTTFNGDGTVWRAAAGPANAGAVGAAGAGRLGPAGGAQATPGGVGLSSVAEGIETLSGASGGGGGTNGANTPGGNGGPSEQYPGGAGGLGAATPAPGGGGGAASRFGPGGAGGPAGGPGFAPAATSYGAAAGGNGGLSTAPALPGANGLILYRFV